LDYFGISIYAFDVIPEKIALYLTNWVLWTVYLYWKYKKYKMPVEKDIGK
jgi:hypothetical protein